MESAFFPGIDKAQHDDQNVGKHDNQGCNPHFLKDQRPRKEKNNFDIKDEKKKSNKIKLNRDRNDVFLKIRAPAFKRSFLNGIGSLRS